MKMNNKHFEFTDEIINIRNHILRRIRATRNIPEHNVKKGEFGGFVESYDNLSENAWVYENAKVYEDARLSGNAYVWGNAEVFGDADVFENAQVYENAKVYGYAWVYGNARVSGDANVFGNVQVCVHARVYGDAKLYGNARVCGDAHVFGHVEVYGHAQVCGYANIIGNAKVSGNALVTGDAHIIGNAIVESNKDYIVFKNFWSSGRYFTWTRSNNMWRVGCFYGTGEELIEKAYKDSEESGKQYKRVVAYVNEILKDEKCNTEKSRLSSMLCSL
jgi:predicted acyltransferase (DUF342 family)